MAYVRARAARGMARATNTARAWVARGMVMGTRVAGDKESKVEGGAASTLQEVWDRDDDVKGECTFRTAKRASCESSCDNNQCRITLHYSTSYFLDEFWWCMTAITKVVWSPPVLFWMMQWNRYTDQGKTISMMGMSYFWPTKKIPTIFVRQRFPPFSESRVSIWTVFSLYRGDEVSIFGVFSLRKGCLQLNPYGRIHATIFLTSFV